MRMYFIAAAAVAVVVAFTPFKRSDKPAVIPPAAAGQSETAPRPVKTNVVAYQTGDEKMNAAKRQARETLPRFTALMNEQASGAYQVKFPLTQNGATEHIWLQVDGHRDGSFHGRLANKPVNGTQYKRGDRMSVAAAQVEDWMVTSGDVIFGGYTARVALADVPEERARNLAKRFRD
jgi:uncharacterized protein YegJ (DUF2314 family)